MRRWKLRKWDFVAESEHLTISREWEIQADRIEVESHSVLKAFRSTRVKVPGVPGGIRGEHLSYISRDWDEVELLEGEDD